MADSRKTVQIKSDPVGDVRIADEVVAIIAGLAATEVDGVSSMAGNIEHKTTISKTRSILYFNGCDGIARARRGKQL